MSQTGKKGFQYRDINEDDEETFALRGRLQRRSPVCIRGSFFALMTGTLVFIGATFALHAGFGFFSAPGDAGGDETACELPNVRVNCIPEGGRSETEDVCLERGCCWVKEETPSCFYPGGFGYAVDGQPADTPMGKTVNLTRKTGQPSQYGGDIETVRVDIFYETSYRLRVKLWDPRNKRYEVPLPTPEPQGKASNPLYKVSISRENSFSFTVQRTSPSRDIFSTVTGLILSNQYLQLTGILPSDNIYGLGEHAMDRFKLLTNNSVLTLFSRDQPPNPDKPGENLYGVHPFYLCMEQDGSSHGVFLLNSNAMEIELGPLPSVTYRTIGGILDFYFFLGPSPEAVVQQYTEVIGRPFMPPYWSLGFHLCRWGYDTANNTLEVVERMRDSGIPQDTQWNDIDYMSDHLDFTYNTTTFAELPDLIANLHSHGQHYVLITDPGIGSMQPRGSYPPYDDGVAMGIFITNSTHQPMIGVVWPGEVAFPDFTNPDTQIYWDKFVSQFHSNVSFDGLWIDMNEPSNFVPGSLDGCPNTSINNPPFLPGVYHEGLIDIFGIIKKTLCMSANQSASLHYNVHSLYGFSEANKTMRALETVLGKRSLVISRSTFPGSGVFGGHWLGDNESKYRHMQNSITGILDFSLFGIPLVGADICGFSGSTTEELCTRWMQLGAFYPFSRNHNSIGEPAQDPAVFSNDSVTSSRDVLLLRYRMLPFLYTLFHFAHVNGSTVARPLFFEFPKDQVTWDVDQQFMWGSAVLVTPVLIEGATSVEGYFPTGARWFDLRKGSEMTSSGHVTLSAPLDTIPVHVRGGSIIALQEPNTTTTESRKNPFALLVALDNNQSGEGWLYWDDGETLATFETGTYSLLHFSVSDGNLSSSVKRSGYTELDNAMLHLFTIYGLPSQPVSVVLNNTPVPESDVEWNGDTKVLNVRVSLTNLNQPFTLTWKTSA
jgi:lysosomal alpha-glucosidase